MKSFLNFCLLVVAFSARAASNVRVTTVTSSTITVTWSVTESEGVTSYRVRVSQPNSGMFHETEVDDRSNGMTIEHLDPDTEYEIRVMAVKENGYQDLLRIITATTAPAAPSVQVTTVTSSSITVTWSVTESEGVIAYRVMVSNPRSGLFHENEVDVSAHETTVDQLDPDTEYEIRVMAVKEYGYQGVLGVITSTTAPVAPSVQVTTVTSSSITVTWSVTESEGVIAYRVMVSNPRSGLFHENEVDVSAHETTVDHLDPDTEYEIRVMAVKEYGYQGVLGVITSTTAPVAPSVQVTTVTSSSITVTWSVTESEGVIAYRVMVSNPRSGLFHENEVDVSAHETTVDHLDPDTEYEIRVMAVKEYGYQGVLGVITSTTAAQSLPDVRVTTVTSSSITVTWSVTESEGVTSYRVRVSEPNSGLFHQIEVDGGAHGTTIEHLEPDTEYELQVIPETLYRLLTPSEIMTVKTTQ
ncbi:hypothetical protein V1264_024245 [Littorina saxatilis]|uniref:Fibronectin type-III domain-containing protein n=1 Tax=Littorina saxatilis TaxID=31220 RepID=A0AAN9FZM3_9CAEN